MTHDPSTEAKTYTIYDIDGSNPRVVTLVQYKAMVAEAVTAAKAKHARDKIEIADRRRDA
jgi:hypothetical protein